MAHILLSALAPIIFVTFLGWLAGRLGLMRHEDRGVLGLFVVRFALPQALFLSATKATVAQLTDIAYLVSLAGGLVGIYLVVFLVARLTFKQDLTTAALRALTCSFPNMAYCGPPVLLAAIGQEALLAVLVGNLISSFVLVPATIVLAHLGQEPTEGEEKQNFLPLLGSSLLGAVRQPLVWLPLAGILVALSGLGVPAVIEASVHQIGQAAGGVALFMLGLMLYGQPVRVDRAVLTNVALKNFAQPAIVFVCASLLGMSGAPAQQIVLLCVLPSATENAVLAQRYRDSEQETSTTIAVSTLMAVVSISLGIVFARLL